MNLKPLVFALCALGTVSVSVYAEDVSQSTSESVQSTTTEQVSKSTHVKKIVKKKHHVKHVKHVKHKAKEKHHYHRPIHQHYHHTSSSVHTIASSVVPAANVATEDEADRPVNKSHADVVRSEYAAPGRSLVTTGPYVGIPLQYSGSNLIINSPSVNTDVQLLKVRKSMSDNFPNRSSNEAGSHLLLSGIVEAQANYSRFGGGNASHSSIDLSNVSLDAVLLGPTEWTTGFIEFSYDHNRSGEFRQNTVRNSRLYVNKAFVTIGDFNQSPFYATFGQYYVPFGTYSSVMISDPLTKVLARIKARALTIGYQEQGDNAFFASAYAFAGSSYLSSQDRINNGGINLGYKYHSGSVQGSVSGGVIRNMTDSVGIQESGFSTSPFSEHLDHAVPAYNLRGSLSIGEHIDLLAEFVSAAKRYNTRDLSFNQQGAKPWAYDLEGAYSFYILNDKPSSVGIGYSRTNEALGLGIPKHQYSAVFNTSLLRNTLQSLEYRYDQYYGAGNSSTVANGPALAADGRHDHVLTAQFDYYF